MFLRSFDLSPTHPGLQVTRTTSSLTLPKSYLLYTDGASSGNNVKGGGHGGAGAVLYNQQGQEIWTLGKYLGHPVTNIMAEYRALIMSLEYVRTILQPTDSILIRFDLQLIYEQLNGIKKANLPHVQQLLATTKNLLTGINYRLEWIPREQNERANGLAQTASHERI